MQGPHEAAGGVHAVARLGGEEGQDAPAGWNRERVFVGGVYGINTTGQPHIGAFWPVVSSSYGFTPYLGLEAEYAYLFGRNEVVGSISTRLISFHCPTADSP
jgi:hypothetical protein